jgi:hypothetical protein
MWSYPGFNFGTIIVYNMYINDLPLGINTDSRPVLLADDTIVFTTASNFNELQNKIYSHTELYE